MKIVRIRDDGTRRTLVEFTKRGGKLVGKWAKGTEIFQREIEDGLVMTAKGVFTPRDGEKFLQAARVYFSRSSSIDVLD